jgi:hypothetical protein
MLPALDLSNGKLHTFNIKTINHITLNVINISNNELTELPLWLLLCDNLEELYCNSNNITTINALPKSLKNLDLSNNNLATLCDLPITLEILNVNNNNLTDLPKNMTLCTKLYKIEYNNNPNLILSNKQKQFMNRLKRNINLIINDIVNDRDLEKIQSHIPQNELLHLPQNERCVTTLLTYCENKEIHTTLNVTFSDILVPVWERINNFRYFVENKPELVVFPPTYSTFTTEAKEQFITDTVLNMKTILCKEMENALCKCYTGRISRLISTLCGFYTDIEIKISDNEQIGNVVIREKEKLGNSYTIEQHKQNVIKELRERLIDETVITEWLTFIE